MSKCTNKSALAKELGVSRSSLYYRPKLEEKDEELRVQIESVMRANPGYGHRRVADALKINRKRALRVMRKFNLKPARRCRTPRKPDDLNKVESSHIDITKIISCISPDIIWTGDFTYISYKGQFIFLAVVQDRWTAEILGARVMKRHTSELVVDPFKDALSKYKTRPEYFHSDQGSEYESKDFKSLLVAYKIKISNSPKSSPWRNGSQESFFGRFKIEFGDFDRFDTLEELMVGIYQYIFYYNQERIHTRFRCSPRSFRQKYQIEKSSVSTHLTQPIHSLPQLNHTSQQLPTELTALRDFDGLTVNSIDNCSAYPLGHPSGADFIAFYDP
jgi:transposase InsO family protein